MNTPINVSALNEQIKGILETTFCAVYVEGEISNLTYHSSGHIYFNIKDEKSTISSVMFRGNAKFLKFRLENGQNIVVTGNITVYAPRGNYQLLCTKIEPSGVGALALAFEQLKTKLQIKGYFDKSIKKPLPRYPKNIFVVTSNTGAAIEDMKKVLQHRYPLAKMKLIPTMVQGDLASTAIVKGIKIADKLHNTDDILIVGRGGGSIEDLWAFNEEIVADAIFSATVPIISAVGHESDFVISDFVADVRASTPSNAIEMSTPSINDLRQYLDTICDSYNNKLNNILYQKNQVLIYLLNSFSQHSLSKKFQLVESNIYQLKQQFISNKKHIINIKQSEIKTLQNTIELNNPKKKDKKGFVQLTKENQIIDLSILNNDDIIRLESSKFIVECNVLSKIEIN